MELDAHTTIPELELFGDRPFREMPRPTVSVTLAKTLGVTRQCLYYRYKKHRDYTGHMTRDGLLAVRVVVRQATNLLRIENSYYGPTALLRSINNTLENLRCVEGGTHYHARQLRIDRERVQAAQREVNTRAATYENRALLRREEAQVISGLEWAVFNGLVPAHALPKKLLEFVRLLAYQPFRDDDHFFDTKFAVQHLPPYERFLGDQAAWERALQWENESLDEPTIEGYDVAIVSPWMYIRTAEDILSYFNPTRESADYIVSNVVRAETLWPRLRGYIRGYDEGDEYADEEEDIGVYGPWPGVPAHNWEA